MSAFKTNKDEIKQLIRSLGLELDTDTWDEGDREALAREIRKRTKPMLIAANKMDTPEAQANWEAITTDPDYDHLTFVPASAHAEGALKKADDNGVIDYTPGADEFEIVGDPSAEQEAGLEQIRDFITEFGGTGVQQAIETALFDVLGCIAVFPGSANGGDDEKGVFRDCFVLPDDATTEDFAYFLHSDIGDGLLHGIDCRTERQVGADHDLSHRDVVEIVSTN
jgi:ribosome-binding ATPase YchF (GTP1/OBG family)